jgi:hypothetical protein
LTYQTPSAQDDVSPEAILDEGESSQPQSLNSTQEIDIVRPDGLVTLGADGFLVGIESTSLGEAAKALLEVLTPPPTDGDTELVRAWVTRQKKYNEILLVSAVHEFHQLV